MCWQWGLPCTQLLSDHHEYNLVSGAPSGRVYGAILRGKCGLTEDMLAGLWFTWL